MYKGNYDEGSDCLRVKEMEIQAQITLVAGVGTIPDGYLSFRDVSRENDAFGMSYVPPLRFDEEKEQHTAGGNPQIYTIKGETIEVAPSWAGDLEVLAYQRIAALTSGAPTNDLLTNYPEIYLYGCLIEAFDWLDNETKKATFLNRYNGAVAGANKTSLMLQHSGSQMRARTETVV